MHNDGLGDDYYDDDDHEPCSKKIMPALFAWFLLISTSASYFTLVLPEYINIVGLDRLHLFITVTAVHGGLFLFVLLNFSIATFMDPGRFPKVDIKDVIEDDGNHQSGSYKNVLINDINVRMKWCTTCQFYRPPRSSHCGVCNACIDTMDHHCPWVCNCIGRRNYKYFLQFLISLTVHMLIILGLCITLVMLNKEELTHIPIIISMFLIVLVGILLIPIGGLTGFHLVLVSRGRTTNEQVTGKFRTGVNPFDEGCCRNWESVVCNSVVPSYLKYRRDKNQHKDYLDSKVMLKVAADPVKVKYNNINKDNTPSKSRQHGQPSRTDESEMAAFLNNNNNQISVSNKEIKRSKRGTSATSRTNSNSEHQIIESQNLPKKKSSSNKKLAKITNNNNGYQGVNRQITSPARQKRQVQTTVYVEANEDFNRNEEKVLFQMNQQKLLHLQHRQAEHNGNVWINRKTNQIVYNPGEEYDNEETKHYKPKNDHNSKSHKHSQKKNRTTTDKINKLMNENKRNSIPNSSTNESSSNSSNRCIRNNSYLNANHTVGLIQAEQANAKLLSSMDSRPSSSSSNSSNSSNKHRQKSKSKHSSQHHNLQQIQLEIINEKNQNFSSSNINPNGEVLPDYASYEITV